MHQLAASTVPNVVGRTVADLDPYAREVYNTLDAVKNRLPVLRQELMTKRDWVGEETKSATRLGGLLPVRVSTESSNPVLTEAARLGVSIPPIPKKLHIGKGSGKLGQIELTPQERDDYAKASGEMVQMILGPLVGTPGWGSIPEDKVSEVMAKRKIFTQAIAQAHRFAALTALPADKREAMLEDINSKLEAPAQP